MKQNDLKDRTQEFALRFIKLTRAVSRNLEGRVIAHQLLRSATSVGANYRAACRARSRREFIARLGVVEEEADESCYWLEIIMKAELVKAALVQPLWQEAEELLRIISASRRTAASRSSSPAPPSA